MLEFSPQNPASHSYGLATLAFVVFFVYLASGWRGGRRAAVLLAAIATSAVWGACNLGFALTGRPVFWTAQTLSDAVRVACWLLFGATLLYSGSNAPAGGAEKAAQASVGGGESASRPAIPFPHGAWWAAFLVLLPLTAWLFPPSAPVAQGSSQAALSRLPYEIALAAAVIGLTLAEQLFRRAADHARWSLKPLCLGLSASFVFDLYMNADALLFGRLDPNLWAARGLAQALIIPFIAVATSRNKDWTLDIALSRGIVFRSAALLASGVYLLAVAGAGYYVRYFGGRWGQVFQVGFIFAALLLLAWLFSSGTLRAKLKVFVSKNFFLDRYDYRQEWLRFTSLLENHDPYISTQQRCIQALANLVESPAGVLWICDEAGVFTPTAQWNLPGISGRESSHESLARFLAKTGWVVNLDEYREHPSRYAELQLPAWLTSVPSAWLIVPIMARDALFGFIVLTTPRTAIDVNWEVLDLLKTFARQVGSFLGFIQSSEALLEAKKFDAFHKMAAFVAHDLKNLVAQLSLLLKNAERHRADPAFQADMLTTVQHVADRMNGLLLQLRSDPQVGEALRPIQLRKVAARIVKAKANQQVSIELEGSGDVLAVAHEQRFERALGNLVQNAIDATGPSGQIRVGVHAGNAEAIVEVADSGCGMSDAYLREKLFRPFQTTKPHGTGIGAYETAQYIRELGGRIEAESRLGTGTAIRMILPLHVDISAVHGQCSNKAA